MDYGLYLHVGKSCPPQNEEERRNRKREKGQIEGMKWGDCVQLIFPCPSYLALLVLLSHSGIIIVDSFRFDDGFDVQVILVFFLVVLL
jgi:hypothetical protein